MTEDIRIEEIKFMSEIHKIIRDNFMLFPQDISNIELSTEQEDTKESFDLVYNSRIEVSVRIRNNYALQWCDLTIRSKSRFGYKCEIDKLIDGKGSVYLYAWKTIDNSRFETWILIDINKIRHLLPDFKNNVTMNRDGTGFITIKIGLLKIADAIINFYNLPSLFLNR